MLSLFLNYPVKGWTDTRGLKGYLGIHKNRVAEKGCYDNDRYVITSLNVTILMVAMSKRCGVNDNDGNVNNMVIR